jgi:hypothetical protein
MDYWELLKPALPEGGLTQKASKRRLNDARAGLKHSGNRPSNDDIEAYRVAARLFFDENTHLAFRHRFEHESPYFPPCSKARPATSN